MLTSAPPELPGCSDPDLEALKPVLEKERITWRSFWNGPESTQGPIAKRWGVHSWPTVYVLDGEGRIRFKNVREERFDKAVDQLIAEMRGKTTPAEQLPK